MKRFRLVHIITEESSPEPVVIHQFYGATKEEAFHVYEAHRKSDAFLRGCDDHGEFKGRLSCHSTMYLEELDETERGWPNPRDPGILLK